ncbi:MAG: hypothetical protein ACRCXZ_06275 [Patescibacteria group bacterium]
MNENKKTNIKVSSVKLINILLSILAVVIIMGFAYSGFKLYDAIDGILESEKIVFECENSKVSILPTIKNNGIINKIDTDQKIQRIGFMYDLGKKIISLTSSSDSDFNFPKSNSPDITNVKILRKCLKDYQLNFYQYQTDDQIASEIYRCTFNENLDSSPTYSCSK